MKRVADAGAIWVGLVGVGSFCAVQGNRKRVTIARRWILDSHQLPTKRDTVGDVATCGAFADVHRKHSSKRARTGLEDLHRAVAQTVVMGHEEHQARHQHRTATERAMSTLVAREVSDG